MASPMPQMPRLPSSAQITDKDGNLVPIYQRLLQDTLKVVADLQARVKALGG